MTESASPTPAQWLRANAYRGGRWHRVIIAAATGSTLLLLVQAWAIASAVHQLAIAHAAFNDVLIPLLILPLTFIGRGALAWLKTEAGTRCGLSIRQSIRHDVMQRISERGPLWARRQHSATLGNHVWEQVDALQNYYADYRPQMSLCVWIPLIILLATCPISWAASLILLITGPLIPLNMAMIGWGAKNLQDEQYAETRRMGRHFLDTLKGLPTLKLFGRAREQAQEIHTVSERVRQRTMRVLRLAFLSSAALEFFASVSIALLAIYIGFTYLDQFDFGTWGKGLSLFGGLFVLILSPEFYQPLRDLGTHYHAKAEAETAAEALIPLLEADDVHDEPSPATPAWSVPQQLGISFDHVYCRYPQQTRAALEDVSFTLQPGEMLAIVGPSGAGKSTLLNTLLRFMPPKSGRILTDQGEDLRQIGSDDWRQAISWVSQQNALLPGSLRDNLQLALPATRRDELDDALFWEALEHTDLKRWAEALPEQLDTRIGDGGQPISGGQARRIALSRAFLRAAPLVLLDEPTASLDRDSERIVNQAIAQLSERSTVILLTHRLSLLRLADHVLMLKQGCVQAYGPLEALSSTALAPFMASIDQAHHVSGEAHS